MAIMEMMAKSFKTLAATCGKAKAQNMGQHTQQEIL